MKLVMTLLVRDEEDIIRYNIDYHASQGVDFFIVTDNNSEDSTVSILQEYEKKGILLLLHEPDDTYMQCEWVSRMARLAHDDYHADWVINNDADEFWWSDKGTLKEVLSQVSSSCGIIKGERMNFYPREESSVPFYRAMDIKDKISLNSDGVPLLPKVCHRGVGDAVIVQGNHRVTSDMLGSDSSELTLDIFHFPLRSYKQFSNKIVKGGAAYARNTQLPKGFGKTWRGLYKTWQEHGLKDYYDGQVLKEYDIPGQMQTGDIVRDQRLKNYLTALTTPLPMPFIVGAARSGTTLLRLMLDAHPDLTIPPETHFLSTLSGAFNDNSIQNYEQFHAAVTQYWTWKDMQLDADLFMRRLQKINPFSPQSAVRCFYETYAQSKSKSRIGDKTPPYVFHMTAIHDIIPEAHFIHIIRDGRDVAQSIKNLWWGADNLVDSAKRWVQTLDTATEQAQQLPHYLEIRYEDLILETEKTLAQVCDFLQLSFHEDMLAYYQDAGTRLQELDREDNIPAPGEKPIAGKKRLEIFKLTENPPDQSRVYAWKKCLSEQENRTFVNIAGKHLAQNGYET